MFHRRVHLNEAALSLVVAHRFPSQAIVGKMIRSMEINSSLTEDMAMALKKPPYLEYFDRHLTMLDGVILWGEGDLIGAEEALGHKYFKEGVKMQVPDFFT